MRYLVLASDYDGTVALHGQVDADTVASLERLRESGRKIVLVTGRELDELFTVFPQIELCDWVVAENGALLYHPATRREKPLAERPPDDFIRALDRHGVSPYSVGRVIVATWEPHQNTVLELIREFGLELQVIFNKGAVMVLPTGVNKATGLMAALCEMKLSPHNVVAVGDAENDHALLASCECGVAVENALPALKERADFVTERDHGAGVQQLIDMMIADDLEQVESRLARHWMPLGTGDNGEEIRTWPANTNILVAGSSGGGKSTLATGFLERLIERKYQVCVIDPEGDYEAFEGTMGLGTGKQPPVLEEVLQLLEDPDENAVVNMISVPLQDRPKYFLSLLSGIQELRTRLGHPHWIIVDEAHHVLPSHWEPQALTLPQKSSGMMLVTLQPDLLAMRALEAVDTVVGVGEHASQTLSTFSEALGIEPPRVESSSLEQGQVLIWQRGLGIDPKRMLVAPSKAVRQRHSRKYAEGELDPDRSFHFRGPEGKLNLRAQNLIIFLQLAEGVDDDTWMHHLRGGDYSRWFRECIKDEILAAEAQRIEALPHISPAESRSQIKAIVEEHYTLPGSKTASVMKTV